MISSPSGEPPPIPKKRPVLVWVISLFYAYSIVSTVLSYAVIYSDRLPVTPAQKAYFSSLTAVDHAFTALVLLINLTGALLLFRLKKQAPFLFASAFAFGVATVVYQSATKDWFSAVGIAGLAGAVFGWAINIAVIVYTFLLRKRRILT